MRQFALFSCALTALLAIVPVNADLPQPQPPAQPEQLTLTVTQDQARIADALGVLAKETGYTIVVDTSVIGRMGTAKVCFPTLPKMIDFLKTIEPGLTYTHFYIRGNRPTPSPALCFDIVRTMQWLNQQGNPILLTPNGAISLVNQKAPAPAVLAGMRDIWFVSDEQLRAQEILDQDKVDRRDYSAGAASGQRASQNPAVMPPPGGITRFRQYPLAPNSR